MEGQTRQRRAIITCRTETSEICNANAYQNHTATDTQWAMGYKRSYLTAFAFLGALTFDSQTLNCGPLIAAGSTVEVEIQADIDSGVDDENFNEGETTPSLEYEVNIGDEVESEQSPNSEHGEYENTLPASLARAVLVGAQRRSHEINNLNREDEGELSSDEVTSQEEISEEKISSNSKPQLTGCVWGSVGCNKGKRNTGTNPTGSSINSSTVIEPEEDVLDTPSSSVFSGSATAKIKAHVDEARGVSSNQRDPLSSMKNSRTRLSSRNTVKGTDETESKHKSDDGHKPPQGFELSGRIVTSPGDGLVSYLPSLYFWIHDANIQLCAQVLLPRCSRRSKCTRTGQLDDEHPIHLRGMRTDCRVYDRVILAARYDC